ncbi:sulfatase-like hydrolase/transferase [Microvirga subterranea]|uniref:Sulfatase-like protein n=1 Tax=Microvirga subterranea TaxID=186651 RepID=A0A370HNH6_9HYPH|nr:sulfatase-like protein [Microvirga subterranea]
MKARGKIWVVLVAMFASVKALNTPAAAQPQKPNIVVIMADEIGYWNSSAYNRGMMGDHTPNIGRLANEGIGFPDHYGRQSCPAPRPFNLRSDPFVRTTCNREAGG